MPESRIRDSGGGPGPAGSPALDRFSSRLEELKAMAGAPRHRRTRRWLDGLVAGGGRAALALLVLWEFLHVVTDGKRFEKALTIGAAVEIVRDLESSPDVVVLKDDGAVVLRVLSLLEEHALGRKHILDTALAVTLERAGIGTLATFNPKDYRVFSFLELLTP